MKLILHTCAMNSDSPLGINQVNLVGRVSAPAIEKEMPSGDVVAEFRLIVPRLTNRSRGDKTKNVSTKNGGSKNEVDVLDIAVWIPRLRKRALTLDSDEWIEVEGALRRRFWKSPTGLASRWQVEASEVRRI